MAKHFTQSLSFISLSSARRDIIPPYITTGTSFEINACLWHVLKYHINLTQRWIIRFSVFSNVYSYSVHILKRTVNPKLVHECADMIRADQYTAYLSNFRIDCPTTLNNFTSRLVSNIWNLSEFGKYQREPRNQAWIAYHMDPLYNKIRQWPQ